MCSPEQSKRRRSTQAGFTLLEILVVIAIIAALASMVAPTVFRHVGDARSTTARTQIEAFALALEAYRLDIGEYPRTADGLSALRMQPGTLDSSIWRGPYVMKEIPLDPWRRAYVYESPGRHNPASYDLYSLGKDGVQGGRDEDGDITSWGGTVTP